MPNPPSAPTPDQNHILARLPAGSRSRIFPELAAIRFPAGKVLHEPGDRLTHVYFPVNAIVSLVQALESGSSAEISVVGNEGVVGLAVFMGGESTHSSAVVQTAGWFYRLHSEHLKAEFSRHTALLELLLRYSQALMTQMAQTAVCNRHHTLDQQLCRLLLLSLDRLSGSHLAITQERIAGRLGVRREGVTLAAGKLQKLGIIEYARGRITVRDRAQLEAQCCECYGVVKRETDRLANFAFVQSSD